MGGNALKYAKTERKNPAEYNIIKGKVLELLKSHVFCEAVIETPEKDSFGDLDIIYISEPAIVMKDLIKELFKPSEIVINGNVISFDFELFQIDLIKANSTIDFESKKFYYGYGDLGCILGKLINFYKLKFGDNGLWINIDKTIDDEELGVNANIGKEIILTQEPSEICEFFNLNYLSWLSGFSTQLQLFEWIVSSKYFIRGIFQVENGNDKRRMETRKFYINFMSYIWKDETEPKPERPKIQMYAINYFNKKDELDLIIKQTKLVETRKAKYNGKIFIDFGFSGKEISVKMKAFELSIEKMHTMTFYEWLDSTSEDLIKKELEYFLCK